MATEQIGQRMRRERGVWRLGLLISLLLHLIALLLSNQAAEHIGSLGAAGPRSGSPVAAPAGGGMRAILLAPPVEIRVPPRPELMEIEPVQIETPPELALNEIELRDPGEGREEGPESGAGLPGGEGGGDAGAAEEGLSRLIPPTPRGIIMAPLDRPSSVRGRDVTVWVFIDATGAVDSVRLEPPTPDGSYNDDLTREARGWVFEPARRGGRPVATWWSYTWKL